MTYLSSFEIFVISVRNRYERLTRANFLEDFGTQVLSDLRMFYEQGKSQDESVGILLNRQPRLCRCSCETGNAFFP